MQPAMKLLGLDISTTSAKALLIDADGRVIESASAPLVLSTPKPLWSEQDPYCWWEAMKLSIRQLLSHSNVSPDEIGGIGLTGQMHGILYCDASGRHVGPLYTWLDGRGSVEYSTGTSYAAELSDRTGYPLATGYGAVTHFHHTVNHSVPQEACVFCTIQDYISHRLLQEPKALPVTERGNAAGIGLYSLDKASFDVEAIREGGMDASMFPRVLPVCSKLGKDNLLHV